MATKLWVPKSEGNFKNQLSDHELLRNDHALWSQFIQYSSSSTEAVALYHALCQLALTDFAKFFLGNIVCG
jgi:hypothetical protein